MSKLCWAGALKINICINIYGEGGTVAFKKLCSGNKLSIQQSALTSLSVSPSFSRYNKHKLSYQTPVTNMNQKQQG